MKKRRILSAVTALSVCAGMTAVSPEITRNTYAAEVVANDFEVNYGGWHEVGESVSLIAENGTGVDASRGMRVTGRSTLSDGAASSKGFYLTGGIEYNYGVSVFSEGDERFHVTLTYVDEETNDETTVELISESVKAGEWTTLSAKYKAPKTPTNTALR